MRKSPSTPARNRSVRSDFLTNLVDPSVENTEQSEQPRVEDYLSQMSDQYSAYQTLAAQAAITQPPQAAATALSTTQALATQAALA